LPTCPQQPQQKQKKFKPRFQVDRAARPMPENLGSQNASSPGEINRKGGRHRLGIPGRLHIGTPGRLRRNPHHSDAVEFGWQRNDEMEPTEGGALLQHGTAMRF